VSTGGSKKAVLAALLANLGIALAKLVAFAITRSSSMLAESVHSLADTGNQVLLLFGAARAKKEATPLHPFGYGRERYFWAFMVAIILFTLGAMFAIYEGVEKILSPHELEAPAWAIGTLLVAIVLESWSFRTAMRESAELRGDSGWFQFIRRSKVPELPVVLLEDSGALVGLLAALIAITLSIVTGSGVWDGVGSLVIGSLLFVIALVLAVEMKSLLIGEAADPAVEEQIVIAIEESESVVSLIHLRTEHLGPEDLLVVAKVEFQGDLVVRDLADAVDDVEANIREKVPAARLLFIEPDVRREFPQGPPLAVTHPEI
jgi:cation diffusion facilitator family transporter